jgi:hydroxyacylglutathione hydrolase
VRRALSFNRRWLPFSPSITVLRQLAGETEDSSAEDFMPGNFDLRWIHGSLHCAQTIDPPLQVHPFDEDTFIIRQSKCAEPGTPGNPGPSYEAPFLYLLTGESRALLLDTGASESPALFPIAKTVRQILQDHAEVRGHQPLPLLIAHSHNHSDHWAGDGQFRGMENTVIVEPSLPAVKSFFQLPQWPDGQGLLDLGERLLDVIPIPGHEKSHIAFYDRRTQLLLTGDTLYPGLLVVTDWMAYARSAARLKAFAQANPVSFVCGAHIEMTNQPGRWFGLPTLYQPGEHVLQLHSGQIAAWADSVQAMGAHPRVERHAEFIIYPAGEPFPTLDP